jgi:quercetin dioxygenase-like cupin family protein
MATYLQVVELKGVAELPAATRVLYDVHANTATFSTGSELVADESHRSLELTTEGLHLSFELVDEPAPGALMARELTLPAGEYLLRCDRVDFPPGGEAFLHTHQGPGIRVLLFGSIRIESQGATHTYGPGEPWFESGPDPVHAWTHPTEPTAFVRCMVLPAELKGQRSLRYVRDEDADKPKLQEYRIFVDEPLSDAPVAT